MPDGSWCSSLRTPAVPPLARSWLLVGAHSVSTPHGLGTSPSPFTGRVLDKSNFTMLKGVERHLREK